MYIKFEYVPHFAFLQVGVSLDETVEERDINDLLEVFGCDVTAVSKGNISTKYLFFSDQIISHFQFQYDSIYVVIIKPNGLENRCHNVVLMFAKDMALIQNALFSLS